MEKAYKEILEKIENLESKIKVKHVYKIKELCARLNIGETTARELIEGGYIKYFKIGREYRISEEEVERFIESGGC